MKFASYFKSGGYLSESTILTDSGKELDLSQLPAFLRTLMVTDGTVTKSLEAWFWEPVKVEVLMNALEQSDSTVDGLEVN